MAWIAGIGPIVIQDDQALIVAGPLAAAFSAASVGGVAEGLMAFGLPGTAAHRYEQKIEEGQIVVAVHGDQMVTGPDVLTLFTTGGASDIIPVTEAIATQEPLGSPSLIGST